MPTCWWCNKPLSDFQLEAGGKYCCKTHSERGGTARKRWREREAQRRIAEGLPLCPRPFKKQYASLEHAQKAADHAIEAYACVCGSWHLGHANPFAEERLVRQLAQAARRRQRRADARRATRIEGEELRDNTGSPVLPSEVGAEAPAGRTAKG